MAAWIEIRSERRGQPRLSATFATLRLVGMGIVLIGGFGVLVTVSLGALISPYPLSGDDWLFAALSGFVAGAGVVLFLAVPALIVGLAADAGEALSVAVEDRRTRLAHAADPSRGSLSEPEAEHAGRLSACDERHGLSEPGRSELLGGAAGVTPDRGVSGRAACPRIVSLRQTRRERAT